MITESSLDEMLLQLRLKIDPRDSHNPKYALLHKHIDAIIAAKVRLAMGQPLTVIVPKGAAEPQSAEGKE